MTAKEHAICIYEDFKNHMKEFNWLPISLHRVAVQSSIAHVIGIIEVTKTDPYPRKKTPMDREYWQKVLTELNQM